MMVPHEGASSLQPTRDPVCGMPVAPATAADTVTHRGRAYHFCSAHCGQRFRADPEGFLTPAPPPATAAGGEYTCPMHPEVVRPEPGACPICGMALEPRTVGVEEGPDPELADMSRRLAVSAV